MSDQVSGNAGQTLAAAPCSALELFNRAFSGARTPRSPEYKAGVLAHMKYRMKESDKSNCPYAEGTAQADAWWSGVTESWLILETNNADARRPNIVLGDGNPEMKERK